MSLKIFLGAVIVTAITFAAAVVAVVGEAHIATVETSNQPAFAALHKNPDAVAKIIIRDADNGFTLIRGDGGQWTAPDKFDYSVDRDKVRNLVVKMADMQLIEPKTARPDLYHRLEVGDLDAADAQSRYVRLESKDGTVLAEALFGKTVNHKTGPANTGIYLRPVGSERAWLVSSDLAIDTEPNKWLDSTIVDLASGVVRRVAVRPQASRPYAIERKEGEDDFHVVDLPDDVAIKQNDVNRIGSEFASLTFEDVKPKDQMSWPEAADTAKLETFDNLGIEARLAKVEDKTWIQMSASYLGDEADDSEDAKAARQRAADINQRVGKWVYQIPDYAADRLRRPLDELLEIASNTS